MNARMYLALVLFGSLVVVQPHVVAKDKAIENELGGKLVGDMMFTQEQFDNIFGTGMDKSRRALGVNPIMIWPDGVIPYNIEIDDAAKKQMILTAMEEWQTHTCVNFTQTIAKNDTLMIKIISYFTGCFSFVGRIPLSGQFLNLDEGCWHPQIILHELGHTIGLGHEHMRPDRDEYVTINYENIQDDDKNNFNKTTSTDYTTLTTEYDYFSIMHYRAGDFSINNKDTITTKDPAMQTRIGKSTHLSFRDIKGVNILYNCKGVASDEECKLEDSDCPGDGFVDKTCSCMCSSVNGLDEFPVPCLPTSNGTMNATTF